MYIVTEVKLMEITSYFSKDAVNGCWKWGNIYRLPIVSYYS